MSVCWRLQETLISSYSQMRMIFIFFSIGGSDNYSKFERDFATKIVTAMKNVAIYIRLITILSLKSSQQIVTPANTV